MWVSYGTVVLHKETLKQYRNSLDGFLYLKPGVYTFLHNKVLAYIRFKRKIPSYTFELTNELWNVINDRKIHDPYFTDVEWEINGKICVFRGTWNYDTAQGGGSSRKPTSVLLSLACNPQYFLDLSQEGSYKVKIFLYKLKKAHNYGTGLAIYKIRSKDAKSVDRKFVEENEPFCINPTDLNTNFAALELEMINNGNYIIIPFTQENDDSEFFLRVEYVKYTNPEPNTILSRKNDKKVESKVAKMIEKKKC